MRRVKQSMSGRSKRNTGVMTQNLKLLLHTTMTQKKVFKESKMYTLVFPLQLMHVDAPVEADNVWKLDPEGRRRLITHSHRDRYVMAMEELKDSIKQYNVTRELYEVRFTLSCNCVLYS